MADTSNIRLRIAALGLLLFLAGYARGCSTPVFRYALERWEASPYVVVVCHNGPLTSEQEKHVESLRPPEAGSPQPNLNLTKLDLSTKDEPFRAELEKLLGRPLSEVLQTSTTPQVLILFPILYARKSAILWTGPLDAADLKVLSDSPLRREVARNLLLGNAAVWLQVDSGDAEADTKAETLLRENLKRLEGEIELPPADGDEDPALVQEEKKEQPAGTQKPAFALLRMKPGSPEERLFEKMLRIDEFWKEKKAPLVFAIYGRGRWLAGLTGEEICAEYLGEICAFICGRCSCQIKEDNPGYDLLMTVDWYGGVRSRDEVDKALAPPLISPTGLAAAVKAATEAPVASPADQSVSPLASPEKTATPVLVNALLFLGGLVILIAIAGLLMRARRS